MKKRLSILLIMIMTAAVLQGCASPAPAQSPAASSTATPAPVIPTTPPDITEDSASAAEENLNEITYNGWTYYLDEEDPIVVNYGEDPLLHRKSTDGSSDENLGIRVFEFDIIGDFIYADSNYPDLDENGNQTWSTTRMNLDGSDMKRLEYGSMSARHIPEGEQKFYFTTTGDSAVYVSDFSCETVTPLIITLPDESELNQSLGADRELQLDINEVADGWIDFDATFLTPEGISMYNGSYRITEDGTSIEKIKGTYYDYQSMESELD